MSYEVLKIDEFIESLKKKEMHKLVQRMLELSKGFERQTQATWIFPGYIPDTIKKAKDNERSENR